jgi:hypothetical protein
VSRLEQRSWWSRSGPSLALSLALAGPACSSQNKSNYALAGVAIAAAVTEAAVQRAVTGSCWGQCEYGTRCDEKAGLCVPVESWTGPAPPPPLPSASAATPEPDDSCAGYCLEDERCVLVPNGDVDCVPKKSGDRTQKPAP